MTQTIKKARSYFGEFSEEETAKVALVLNEGMAAVPAARIAREFRKMPRHVPVLVLIPKSAVIAKAEQNEPETNRPSAPMDLTAEASCPLSARHGCFTGQGGTEAFAFGEVTVNVSAMETHRKGQLVPLTCKEFRILAYFIKNPRRVISRDEFLNEVWGYQNYPCTRTVDNHMWQLRRKLEIDPARPKHIYTVHGTGYRFLP